MQIRLPPGPRQAYKRYASAVRLAVARNRQEFEFLTCIVGLTLGVLLGAASIGIAHGGPRATPPSAAAAPSSQSTATQSMAQTNLLLIP